MAGVGRSGSGTVVDGDRVPDAAHGGRSRQDWTGAIRAHTEEPLRQGHLGNPWIRFEGGFVLGDADYAKRLLKQTGADVGAQTEARRLAHPGRIEWGQLVGWGGKGNGSGVAGGTGPTRGLDAGRGGVRGDEACWMKALRGDWTHCRIEAPDRGSRGEADQGTANPRPGMRPAHPAAPGPNIEA